jgi:hypothetical protein
VWFSFLNVSKTPSNSPDLMMGIMEFAGGFGAWVASGFLQNMTALPL